MTHKKSRSGLLLGSFFCAFLINLLIADYAFPQTAFYEGKTIKVIAAPSPGGLGDRRIRAVIPFLKKYIPGEPYIVIEYMPGAGGQKAANYVHRTARPDGLTIGFWDSGTVPAAVLGQPGVAYDIHEVIFLGAHQSGRPSVFLTRKELGLDSLEKLRAVSGLRIGAQAVGHGSYYLARIFAYLFGLREPRWVTGYSGPESDVAIVSGEIDARAVAIYGMVAARPDWVEKGLMHFHAVFEVPRGRGHPHPRFAQLPDYSNFAKSDRERKLIELYRGTQSVSHPIVLPPGTPKERVQILQEAVRKAFEDPQFYKEYEKLAGEEPRPLTPDAIERQIKDMSAEPEIVDFLKRIGGPDALPPRR
ncbi:MAG: hypothetical protein HYY45_15345 [Deltaproteobacteria bacterium]|nr:hypothetical protein [Deltaproteobacteria bacterium]